MNRSLIKLLTFCLFCMVLCTSCERYPISALLGVHDRVEDWPNPWYIYDDEINTKGSMEPFKWDDSDLWVSGKLNFACTDNPQSGSKCILFKWKGNVNNPSSYAGFGLMSTEYPGVSIDMSNSGYTNLKFWIRGSLYSNCIFKIEIPRKDNVIPWISYQITKDSPDLKEYWQEVVIPIPNVEYMKDIEYDIAMSLSSNGVPTNGGTVYIDNIRFTKD